MHYFLNERPKEKKACKYQGGFSLIEALVAIALLTTAVTGPLVLAQSSLSAATAAREQLIASFLAQDAVEYIRYKRDSNFLAGAPSPLTADDLDLCADPNGCQVDSDADLIEACSGGCERLFYDSATGVYNYDPSGEETPFIRSVVMSALTGNEYRVTITVAWQAGLASRSLVSETILYDWLDIN